MFPMLRVGFVLWFGILAALGIEAQPLAQAAAPLAARISSLLPRRATVSLEFQNLAIAGAGRIVQLPRRARSGVAQGGHPDNGQGAA